MTISDGEVAMPRILLLPILFAACFAAAFFCAGTSAQAQTPLQAPARENPAQTGPQAAPAPSPAPYQDSGDQAPGSQPSSSAAGPVRPIEAFFAASVCRAPANASEAEAKRLCYLKTRMKLTAQAAGYVGKTARELGYSLSPDEVKAFADVMLTVNVVDEDVRQIGGTARVQVSLLAEEDASQIAKKLAFYAENAGVRQKAVEEYRNRAAQNAALRDTGPGAAAEIAERAADIDKDMRQAEKNAQRYVKAGMNYPEVVDILGEPRSAKEGAPGEGYLCASYGRIWVVFKEGLASCLRTRLEYQWRHKSDCHCAGNLSTIIPLN